MVTILAPITEHVSVTKTGTITQNVTHFVVQKMTLTGITVVQTMELMYVYQTIIMPPIAQNIVKKMTITLLAIILAIIMASKCADQVGLWLQIVLSIVFPKMMI